MISPVREDALRLLARLSELRPEIRLGQLLVNLSYMARGMKVESIWDMEDEELVAAATKHIDQWQALHQRRASAAGAGRRARRRPSARSDDGIVDEMSRRVEAVPTITNAVFAISNGLPSRIDVHFPSASNTNRTLSSSGCRSRLSRAAATNVQTYCSVGLANSIHLRRTIEFSSSVVIR